MDSEDQPAVGLFIKIMQLRTNSEKDEVSTYLHYLIEIAAHSYI